MNDDEMKVVGAGRDLGLEALGLLRRRKPSAVVLRGRVRAAVSGTLTASRRRTTLMDPKIRVNPETAVRDRSERRLNVSLANYVLLPFWLTSSQNALHSTPSAANFRTVTISIRFGDVKDVHSRANYRRVCRSGISGISRGSSDSPDAVQHFGVLEVGETGSDVRFTARPSQ